MILAIERFLLETQFRGVVVTRDGIRCTFSCWTSGWGLLLWDNFFLPIFWSSSYSDLNILLRARGTLWEDNHTLYVLMRNRLRRTVDESRDFENNLWAGEVGVRALFLGILKSSIIFEVWMEFTWEGGTVTLMYRVRRDGFDREFLLQTRFFEGIDFVYILLRAEVYYILHLTLRKNSKHFENDASHTA